MFGIINIALNVIVLLLLFGLISKVDGLTRAVASLSGRRTIAAEPPIEAEDGDRH